MFEKLAADTLMELFIYIPFAHCSWRLIIETEKRGFNEKHAVVIFNANSRLLKFAVKCESFLYKRKVTDTSKVLKLLICLTTQLFWLERTDHKIIWEK